MASGYGIRGGTLISDFAPPPTFFFPPSSHHLHVLLAEPFRVLIVLTSSLCRTQTGRSRCFPFWQEFSKCYAMADKPEECVLQRDDYLECLHHTKEVSPLLLIVCLFL